MSLMTEAVRTSETPVFMLAVVTTYNLSLRYSIQNTAF
jgi:hypothetical protein